MRRALVLTDENARHPFRASLPPHVRRGGMPQWPVAPARNRLQDLKDFLLAYCACFIAISAFLI